MKPIPELEGKNIAIIAMGNSQLDYHKMITHSKTFDEVWAINAMHAFLAGPRPQKYIHGPEPYSQ